MNKTSRFVISVLGIIAIIIIAMLIVSTNRDQVSSTENSIASSTGYPIPTNNPPYPIGTVGGIRVTETSNNTPIPHSTPIPIPTGIGYSASLAERIILSDSTVTEIYAESELSEDYLYVAAEHNSGTRALLKIDVTTGDTEKLVEIPSSSQVGFEDIRVDGENIIWTGYENGGVERHLYHLSTSSGQFMIIQQNNFSYPSIKGNRILWVDSFNNIVSYDLETQTTEILINQDDNNATSSPQECSNNEIVFLDNFARPSASSGYVSHVSADLVLFTVSTGQRTMLGRVTHAPNGPIERNKTFDCDAEQLVWVANQVEVRDTNNIINTSELYVYSFASRSSSQITSLSGDYQPYAGSVMLDAGVVVSRVGYDLETDTVFSPYREAIERQGVQLENSRLVWSEIGEGARAVYVIQIEQGGE